MLEDKFGYAPNWLIFDPSYVAVLLYRISRYFRCRGYGKTGRAFFQLNLLLTGADIHPDCDIEGGLLIPSPIGVCLSGKIGRDFTVFSFTGTGIMFKDKDVGAGPGQPLLGDRVVLHSLSGVMGPIVLGEDTFVMCGAMVSSDVPSESVVESSFLSEVGSIEDREEREEIGETCRHGQWGCTLKAIKGDAGRYSDERYKNEHGPRTLLKTLSVILTNQFAAVVLYRLSHCLYTKGWKRLAFGVTWLNVLINKTTINPESCIGDRLFLPHPIGMVFCGRAGNDVTLFGHGLCSSFRGTVYALLSSAPVLGDRVMISGHAGVFGPVSVGNDARIAANVRCFEDIGPGVVAFSPMTRTIVRPRPSPEDVPPERVAGASVQDSSESQHVSTLTRRETIRLLRDDKSRLKAMFLESGAEGSSIRLLFPGYFSVWLFRWSHYFARNNHRRLARWCWLVNAYITGADITPGSEIGGGFFLPHPAGVAIHCRAGSNLTVMAVSGIGPVYAGDGEKKGFDEIPVLGDGVCISYHSGVYGPVTLGDDVQISPGCIVNYDVPSGACVVGAPLTLRPPKSTVSPSDD